MTMYVRVKVAHVCGVHEIVKVIFWSDFLMQGI